VQRTTNNKGVYILELCLIDPITIPGKFDNVIFPKGYYYYTGSAQKNLSKRLERHSRKDKKLHWHIDHITSDKACIVTHIWVFSDRSKENECLLAAKLLNIKGLRIPVKGFGSSDCTKCDSHLLYSPGRIKKRNITL